MSNAQKLMEVATEWCKKHNSVLTGIGENGFYYINFIGEWYIAFDSLEGGI